MIKWKQNHRHFYRYDSNCGRYHICKIKSLKNNEIVYYRLYDCELVDRIYVESNGNYKYKLYHLNG
jgi:hypothetical protein